MLRAYGSQGDRLVELPVAESVLPAGAIWIDALDPTPEERALIEQGCGLALPSAEEMSEIEESSRLYLDDGKIHMTVLIPIAADTSDPSTAEATFILDKDRLITLRHADPRPFQTFAARCTKEAGSPMTSDLVTVALAETIVDRLADLMQRVDRELDAIGRRIFGESGRKRDRNGLAEREFSVVLKRLGRANRLDSMVRDSLLTIARITPYLRQQAASWAHPETMGRLETLGRDIRSLSDYDAQINQEVTFLLEATLGLISVRQNAIIKVFSVAAVLFLPPTIVASVYGMNFRYMPELDWLLGYPMAVVLMIASGLGCFWIFKWRGWL
ncbi:MAG: magnesium transporter CorA family protein [Rhodospirillaceae bacterium]|nr:magnesium transporter CorA family protein [Rhodospirillaceae bacterium]